jgi:S-adenosylmethionine hydrolase
VNDGCLTLVTDYGEGGGFVGALHAVAFSIAPEVRVLDIDHAIPAGDIRLGSLRMERMLRYVPPGVHVGVVDPGVGTSRRPIAIKAGGRMFVGPDNGLLVPAALTSAGAAAGSSAPGQAIEAAVLDDDRWLLSPRAATFDGRDVFAPVAAHLASGVPFSEIGSAISPESLVRLGEPLCELSAGAEHATLQVLQIDGFGNVQLAGDAATLEALGLEMGEILAVESEASGRLIRAQAVLGRAFGDVRPGEALVLIDSDGCVAVSVNGGRADDLLGLPGGPGRPGPRARPRPPGEVMTVRLSRDG